MRSFDDLPPGYYRQLPKLAVGPFAGYPRVFGIAWAFVAHTDSRFDPEMLVRFVRAYQKVQPLTIGELWAVSITLRIVLIENLGRLADRSRKAAQSGRRRIVSPTGCWARAAERPNPFAVVLVGACSAQALSNAFAVQLVHRLRDQDPRITPALDLAGRAPGGAGDDRRRGRARCASPAGRGERHRAQHHHQPAPDLRCRLEGTVREASASSTIVLAATATSRAWIFRRARFIAARSRNWRAARAARNSISPALRCARQSRPRPKRRRRSRPDGAILDTF